MLWQSGMRCFAGLSGRPPQREYGQSAVVIRSLGGAEVANLHLLREPRVHAEVQAQVAEHPVIALLRAGVGALQAIPADAQIRDVPQCMTDARSAGVQKDGALQNPVAEIA